MCEEFQSYNLISFRDTMRPTEKIPEFHKLLHLNHLWYKLLSTIRCLPISNVWPQEMVLFNNNNFMPIQYCAKVLIPLTSLYFARKMRHYVQ